MAGGRPKKEIDKKNFEKLCAILCTQEEICGFFGVTDKTLTKWVKETYQESFSDTYKKYSAGGKISLRRYQLELAKKSSAMAIWLGKQWLGQRDEDLRSQVDVNTSILESIAGVLKKREDDDNPLE